MWSIWACRNRAPRRWARRCAARASTWRIGRSGPSKARTTPLRASSSASAFMRRISPPVIRWPRWRNSTPSPRSAPLAAGRITGRNSITGFLRPSRPIIRARSSCCPTAHPPISWKACWPGGTLERGGCRRTRSRACRKDMVRTRRNWSAGLRAITPICGPLSRGAPTSWNTTSPTRKPLKNWRLSGIGAALVGPRE